MRGRAVENRRLRVWHNTQRWQEDEALQVPERRCHCLSCTGHVRGPQLRYAALRANAVTNPPTYVLVSTWSNVSVATSSGSALRTGGK